MKANTTLLKFSIEYDVSKYITRLGFFLFQFLQGICSLILAEFLFITILQVRKRKVGWGWGETGYNHHILVKNVSVTAHCKKNISLIFIEKEKSVQ